MLGKPAPARETIKTQLILPTQQRPRGRGKKNQGIDPAETGANEIVVVAVGDGDEVSKLRLHEGDRINTVPSWIPVILNCDIHFMVDYRDVLGVIENPKPIDPIKAAL